MNTTQTRAAKPPIKFGLGSQIRYTRRAAVARKHSKVGGTKVAPYWGLHEGWSQRESVLFTGENSLDNLLDRFDPGESINKAIFEWDEDGIGVVIGLVKRGVGESVGGRLTPATPFNDGGDFDSGYFVARGWRWLYAVRHELNGTDYILVPVENATAA